MRSSNSIRSLLRVCDDNPELTRSQLSALGRQLPLLYFILVVNTIAVCVTHFRLAPLWLSVYLPGALCIVCLWRAIHWWQRRAIYLSHDKAVSLLRKTVRLTVVFGIAFTAWALKLYEYGDAYAQAHIAFYMSITVIGCIFCLMHLRPAALLLTAIVVIPWTIFFVLSGQPVFIAIAVNIALVALAMMVILFINYRDFANLIDSKKQLLKQQAATQTLSDDNFRLANLDSMTGLPNRRSFFSSLDAMLVSAEAQKRRFAVGLIDLDGFKQVNDAYGHSVGDRLLSEAANRLVGIACIHTQVSRLGGDEFGILIDRDMTREELLMLGNLICATLKDDVLIRDATVGLLGSVGFATFPDAGVTSEELFERADYAMYFAKRTARGSSAIFSSMHETQIRRASVIEQELRLAVHHDQMTLAFQPIVDLHTTQIVGFEALARWTNGKLGVVGPDEFIPVAERSDLVHRLTTNLLTKALAVLTIWPSDVFVSFNLSVRDLSSSEQTNRIIDIVRDSGIDPARIEFEVTETTVMPDIDQACASIAALRRLGARIALDDFGSGHSSLSYVHRLPLDKIKIDRSFIEGIELDKACRDIVRTVVDMCHRLKVECTVEGIETNQQRDAVVALGCNSGQGYMFGKPMSEQDALACLMTRSQHQ
ncbi:histidine kinase [Burkholderia sp. PAMC 28687]|uniref:Diguanylate cyclase/phosphodiesterase (GGDEF & EAL domains) with PAS/PAC sensor(S) n=1 Tax=Caballeronia sordidicola TaxID=196367 RepID=A0A242N870_CABSO|nr:MULTISPECIES: EAL domain-containing protein [Burkholderiaceae]AMM13835.1 histidine kinase [Burkholderia sp. PAMC 28687]OTP79614.1 diguanylate cyclase/phosphodiesterase (GGDEF & EAL domains) with PAS/PAC sensor(s) [Caballeronia sordidicola]